MISRFTSFLPLFTALAILPLSADEAAKKPTPPPPPTPTHADLPYDSHPETILDFWKAEGESPRPLLVYIHGGGWRGGKKDLQARQVDAFLEQGISVASIHYRLTPANPLPAPVHDAARAIQFLRSKAAEWNLDKDRLALTGGSAGACTSMWLATHDDLADPDSEDPVLRESTRVLGVAASGGQTSIDPKVIQEWLGPNVLTHAMIWSAVGETTMAEALANYDSHVETYREFSPINHVSEGDPPLFLNYGGDMTLPSKNAGHGIHHPYYGVKMKEACDAAGVTCHLNIPGTSTVEAYPNANAFLSAILLGKDAP